MQVACLRCLPARKPLRRFSTLRRFPPFLPCRTPVRSISDTHPVDIGHRSGPNRTPFRSHRKTVRHQSGRLSDFNRNTVRFESERCPTSNRIGVRFASEYAVSLDCFKSRGAQIDDHRLGPPNQHRKDAQPRCQQAEGALFNPERERSNKEVLKHAAPGHLEHTGRITQIPSARQISLFV
jgi:hypothetical protein